MWKAGGIGAAVGFVAALLLTLLTPLCDPCAALFIGLGAGVLAAFWERPAAGGDGALKGAEAGAIATVGSLLGQMVGAVLNGIIVGPEKAAQLIRQFGLPVEYQDPAQYWAYLLSGNCCCGLMGVLLGAGLGAVGGLIGHHIWGKPAGSVAEPGLLPYPQDRTETEQGA